ncbi:unnamed protein product [Closterium sp. NIES-54]
MQLLAHERFCWREGASAAARSFQLAHSPAMPLPVAPASGRRSWPSWPASSRGPLYLVAPPLQRSPDAPSDISATHVGGWGGGRVPCACTTSRRPPFSPCRACWFWGGGCGGGGGDQIAPAHLLSLPAAPCLSRPCLESLLPAVPAVPALP